jgi:hypothetical protein
MDAHQDLARAEALLIEAEQYLSPTVVRSIRTDIEGNEPELGLETLLGALVTRAQPLPRSLVEELLSRPDQIFQWNGPPTELLNQLAALVSDDVGDNRLPLIKARGARCCSCASSVATPPGLPESSAVPR